MKDLSSELNEENFSRKAEAKCIKENFKQLLATKNVKNLATNEVPEIKINFNFLNEEDEVAKDIQLKK